MSVLRQTYPHKQLIVADGGSTDETVEVLKRYPEVIWFSEPDRGYADAVNKGLARATGEIIGIQSSDDYYNREAFGHVGRAFLQNPDCGMVTGGRVEVDEELKPITPLMIPTPVDLPRLLKGDTGIFQDATFFRREALETTGNMNLEVDYVADHDLWIRMLSYFDAVVVDHPVSFFLRHPEQRNAVATLKFAEHYSRMIQAWMASHHFPIQLKHDLAWIESATNIFQARWLYRGGKIAEAEEKLRGAIKLIPECRQWSNYRRIIKEMEMKDIEFHIHNTVNDFEWNGALLRGLRRAKSYIEKPKWIYLAFKRRMQLRSTDPRWVYDS